MRFLSPIGPPLWRAKSCALAFLIPLLGFSFYSGAGNDAVLLPSPALAANENERPTAEVKMIEPRSQDWLMVEFEVDGLLWRLDYDQSDFSTGVTVSRGDAVVFRAPNLMNGHCYSYGSDLESRGCQMLIEQDR